MRANAKKMSYPIKRSYNSNNLGPGIVFDAENFCVSFAYLLWWIKRRLIFRAPFRCYTTFPFFSKVIRCQSWTQFYFESEKNTYDGKIRYAINLILKSPEKLFLTTSNSATQLSEHKNWQKFSAPKTFSTRKTLTLNLSQ